MTPAINILKTHKTRHKIHEYTHDESNPSYGDEAAKILKVTPNRVFKTLVVRIDHGELIVAILPVSSQLSMKHVAKAAGAKKAIMADKSEGIRVQGMF